MRRTALERSIGKSDRKVAAWRAYERQRLASLSRHAEGDAEQQLDLFEDSCYGGPPRASGTGQACGLGLTCPDPGPHSGPKARNP